MRFFTANVIKWLERTYLQIVEWTTFTENVCSFVLGDRAHVKPSQRGVTFGTAIIWLTQCHSYSDRVALTGDRQLLSLRRRQLDDSRRVFDPS